MNVVLEEAIGRVGALVEAGGNRPFLLDGTGWVWVVEAGIADVFAVEIGEDREPAGPRRHVLRAAAGEALFGMDAGRHGPATGLLASGATGTRIRKIRASVLQGLVRDPDPHSESRAAVANLVSIWVGKLSTAISSGPPTRRYEELDETAEREVRSGAQARPRSGVLWVRPVEGGFSFLGRSEAARPDGDTGSFVPVTADTGIEADRDGPVRLRAVGTAAYLVEDPAWEDLARFHAAALDALVRRAAEEDEGERSRQALRAESDHVGFSQAMGRLASILAPGKAAAALETGEDPLLAATQTIGASLGIAIRPPFGENGRAAGPEERLDAIARASRIRTRRVVLEGDWWQADNGPLLGFSREGDRPVALLTASPQRYVLRDPADGTQITVTAAVAEGIAPLAYTFYRPFPERAIELRDLVRFGLLGSRKDLRAIVTTGIAGGVLGMVTPLATGAIFGTLIPGADRFQLLQLCLVMLACAFAAGMFQIMQGMAIVRLEGRMGATLQSAVWDRLLSLPVPFFRDYTAGDLGVRAMGIDAIRQTLSGTTLSTILASSSSLFNWLLLFHYDARLALVATGLVSIAVAVFSLCSYLQVRDQQAVLAIEGKISGLVLQLVTGISKFRVAGAEQRAFAQWARPFAEKREIAYRIGRIQSVLAVVDSAYPVVASMVVFAMVAAGSGRTEMTTGAFLGFNAAFTVFLIASLQLSRSVFSILKIVPTYRRAKPVLDTLPEIDRKKAHPGELRGGIEVNHVAFRYRGDGPLVIRDVSLSVGPGEFVALVGPSGCGKSTLLRLLLGFETPEAGAIYFDGRDLAGLDLREVRRQIGVVLQSSQIIPGDIFTNIIGSHDLTMDDAWAAARMAGLAEDIEQMPMGMRTIVAGTGGGLSGGQKQRLLIARAIVTKPRIFLLDEATSALDNRTQAIVSTNLQALDASRIVIAHRLSTVIHADRIHVMSGGEIAESGTYSELMAKAGLFAELARRQL